VIKMEGDALNRDIQRHIINACIQWARIKGYSDSTGVLRGLVVLANEPMSLDDLASETGYSKSTVSVNMKQLENLGVVKRIVIPGDKRHRYAPIIDIDIIRTNMLNAINMELQIFSEALDKIEEDLEAEGEKAGHLLKRIADLRESYEQEKKIIDILRKKRES